MPAVAALGRAILPRDQADRGTDLVGAGKALDIIDDRAECPRHHRPHARHTLQPVHDRIVSGGLAQSPVSSVLIASTVRRNGASVSANARGSVSCASRSGRYSALQLARRRPVWRNSARINEMVPDRIATSCRRLRNTCRTSRCAGDVRCVARYHPRRFASHGAVTSRRSVFTLRRNSPYIGA